MSFSRRTLRQSRTPKLCFFCGQDIDIGELYYDCATHSYHGFEYWASHHFCLNFVAKYSEDYLAGIEDVLNQKLFHEWGLTEEEAKMCLKHSRKLAKGGRY